jgi:hypothetical protein
VPQAVLGGVDPNYLLALYDLDEDLYAAATRAA